MRTPCNVPEGWLNRNQAAKYLGVSYWKWTELVKKYGILTRWHQGTSLYRIQDVEAMAKILDKE